MSVQVITIHSWPSLNVASSPIGGELAFENIGNPNSFLNAPWCVDGVFSDFLFSIEVAPGVGNTWTGTFYKASGIGAPVSTGVTVTISGAAKTGTASGPITITDGETLRIHWAKTGTPATSGQVSYTCLFTPTTPGESGYVGYSALYLPTFGSGSGYTSPFWPTYTNSSESFWNHETAAFGAAPKEVLATTIRAAGALTAIRVILHTQPGGANGMKFTLWKALAATPNTFVKQDGSGGTVNTQFTVSGTNQLGSWVGVLPLAIGDRVVLGVEAVGSPGNINISWGSRFAATDHAQAISGGWFANRLTNVPWYITPNGLQSSTTVGADKGLYVGLAHPTQSFDIIGLHIRFDGNVTGASGVSRTLTMYKNNVATALTVTIPLGSSVGSVGGSITINPGDTWQLVATATGSPSDNPQFEWAFIQGGITPGVDAGPDQTIVYPNCASLAGAITPSAPGTWSVTSGPGSVTFDDDTSLLAVACFTLPGVYVLRLSLDSDPSVFDEVTITVNAAGTCSAGPNQTLILDDLSPSTGTVLTGSANFGIGAVITYLWTVVSSPGGSTVLFSDATNKGTTVSFDMLGTYVLRMTATFGAATCSSTVSIFVNDDCNNGAPWVVRVNRVDKSALVVRRTLRVDETKGNRSVLSLNFFNVIRDEFQWRALRDQEIILCVEGVRRFAGYITQADEQPFSGIVGGLRQIIRAGDYSMLLGRTYPKSNLVAEGIGIVNSSVANPTTITTVQPLPAGYVTGKKVVITGHATTGWAGSKSYAFLGASANWSDGETVTIDGVTYTFVVAFANVANTVRIMGSIFESNDNLVRAINGEAGAGTDYGTGTTVHPTVDAITFTSDSIKARARTIGVAGDSIAVSETAANALWYGEGAIPTSFLTNGSDPTTGALTDLNGEWTITVTGASTFTIPVAVGTMGFGGTVRAGFSTKEVLQNVEAQSLTPHLITLDPAMPDGPAAEPPTTGEVTLEDWLNAWSEATNWRFRVTPYRVLTIWEPGTVPAPFTLDASNHNSPIQVLASRTQFTNRVFVKIGGTGVLFREESAIVPVGYAGAYIEFATRFSASSDINLIVPGAWTGWPNVLIVNGANLGPVGWGPTALPGSPWYWDWLKHALVYDPALGSGHVPVAGEIIALPYTIQFPATVSQEDPLDVRPFPLGRGPWEMRVDAPSIQDLEKGQALADSIIAQGTLDTRRVQTGTYQGYAYPGMDTTLTIPKHLVTDAWLIESVSYMLVAPTVWWYEYTFTEGLTSPRSWAEFVKDWTRAATR